MSSELINGPQAVPVRRSILSIASHAAENSARSQQRRVGPSQVGVRCNRLLGYDLAVELDVEDQFLAPVVEWWHPRPPSDHWRATIGVAAHAWLESAFSDGLPDECSELWETELAVTARSADGQVEVSGTLDLYSKEHSMVLDHKVLGTASRNRIIREGPSDRYRAQLHLYGAGAVAGGFPVDRVGLLVWARDGLASDLLVWEEPFDAGFAEKLLARVGAVKEAVEKGATISDIPPTLGDDCHFCALREVCDAKLGEEPDEDNR